MMRQESKYCVLFQCLEQKRLLQAMPRQATVVLEALGTHSPSKTDEFSEKFQRGGGGIIFNPKIYVADFCHYRRYFGHEFQKKLQHNFPKMRGGGSKAVWNFSENSSVLEGVSFPNPYLISVICLTPTHFVAQNFCKIAQTRQNCFAIKYHNHHHRVDFYAGCKITHVIRTVCIR